jgi:hypothetical protein
MQFGAPLLVALCCNQAVAPKSGCYVQRLYGPVQAGASELGAGRGQGA